MTTTAPPKDIPVAEESAALRAMLAIALPTVATMLSYTLMQFVDKYYVARLGVEPLAAAGNGGIAAFFPVAVMMGILGVVNTYVSQHLGAGRPDRAPAYAWNALWLSLAVWACVLLPYAAGLPWIMATMRAALGLDEVSASLAHQESLYGRILLAGMFFTIASRGMAQFFFGLHRPLVPAVAVTVGNAVNWFFTWGLVFGNLGMPEMGLAGSAVATVIGTIVEFAIPMAVFLSARYHRLYRARAAWRPSGRHLADIWRIGWPAGLMFGNEMICWWMFMAGLVAQFGAAHNAAGWLALQYMQLSFMPAVGMSFAVTAVVGRCIGAGRRDLAARRAWLGLRVTMVYMAFCAVLFIALRGPMIAFFTSGYDPDLAREIALIGGRLLILAAVFQVFDGMGITMIGALRGAGDTVWPGVVTAVLAWTVIIGGGKATTVLWPEIGSIGPWIAASAYIILLGIALIARWSGGRWKTIEVVRTPAHSLSMAEAELEGASIGASAGGEGAVMGFGAGGPLPDPAAEPPVEPGRGPG